MKGRERRSKGFTSKGRDGKGRERGEERKRGEGEGREGMSLPYQ